VPAAARRRRVTLANVSAVCEQLGEHVSTRNVHRVLGGSLRDIGPLVQAWKRNRAETAATGARGDQGQALGAILRGALQEHGTAVAAALAEQTRSNAAAHQALLARVEALVRGREGKLAKAGTSRSLQDRSEAGVAGLTEVRHELKELQAGVSRLESRGADAASIVSSKDFAALSSHIDGLTKAIEQLQLAQPAPAHPEVEALLAPVIARLHALGAHLSTRQMPEHAAAATLLPVLARIDAQMTAPRPTARTQPSKAVLTRLDTLLAEMAALPGRMKEAPRPAARKRAAKSACRQAPCKKAGAKKATTKKAIAKKVALQKAVAKNAVATKKVTMKAASKRTKTPVRARSQRREASGLCRPAWRTGPMKRTRRSTG
jgi:hypothetical protein